MKRSKPRNNKNIKKRSVIIAAAVLSGKLLFGNFRELQKYSTPLIHEKTISNQELNSLEGYHNSGKIIRTGNGTILKFQKEVSDLSLNKILSEHNMNERDEVILVKYDKRLPGVLPGVLPGADGFTLNNNFQKPRVFGHPRIGRSETSPVLSPQNTKGLVNLPKTPKIRSFKEVDTGLNAKHRNRQYKCPAPKVDLEKEYRMFREDMAQKGLEVECDQQRFNDLCVNQQLDVVDDKSVFEAKGCLQGEGEKLYKNLRRPTNPDVKLDFEATDIKTGKRIFVDHKGMIDFQSLADRGLDISRLQSHQETAFSMGQNIPNQKKIYIGLPQGPKSENEVLHLVNFVNMRNSSEKTFLVQAVLDGAKNESLKQAKNESLKQARNESYDGRIEFINYQ
jgi:hypothetical protein